MGTHRSRLAILAVAVLALVGAPRPAAAGEAEQIAALRAIAERLPKIGWAAARRALEAFDKANPDLGPEARDERKLVVAATEEARAEHFRAFTGGRLEPLVRERIRGRLRLKTSTHDGEKRWIEGSAEKECLDALRQEVRAEDPAATDAEIARFWGERQALHGDFRRIRWPVDVYGTEVGGWRVAPWKGRVDYLFARFLLASRLFEVVTGREYDPCPRCDGSGTLTIPIDKDAGVTVLCPTCGGRRRFQRLLYR